MRDGGWGMKDEGWEINISLISHERVLLVWGTHPSALIPHPSVLIPTPHSLAYLAVKGGDYDDCR